jgi:hypothetical protein
MKASAANPGYTRRRQTQGPPGAGQGDDGVRAGGIALVRAGARFADGKLVERPDESGGDTLNGLDASAWRRQNSGGASRDSIIGPGKLAALTDWGIVRPGSSRAGPGCGQRVRRARCSRTLPGRASRNRPETDRKYSEVLWQGRWCLLLQSVIVICVARKVTALAVGVGLLELGEPKCVRELVELCR